jgi:RND superfamily putative drug exporter
MPDQRVLPADAGARVGAERARAAFGPGWSVALDVVVPTARAGAARAAAAATPGVAGVAEHGRAAGAARLTVLPAAGADPDDVVDGLRGALPAGSLVGGTPAERHDLERTLARSTPLVFALVLGVGLLLLVAILRAPVIAAVAAAMNLLSTAAAFGVAKLLFQDGHAERLLGFTSQGFVDAWAPVFFFALIFALAMDYTVFLLASVRERLAAGADVREAAVEGIAASGRIVNAAAAVMVFVFFTFALSRPLPPKEMGVILGVAVLLDATLVRLVLLPAALRALGRAAWWSPSRRSGGLVAEGAAPAPETAS